MIAQRRGDYKKVNMKLSALIPLLILSAVLTGCASPCYVNGPKNGLPMCPTETPQKQRSDAKIQATQNEPDISTHVLTATPDAAGTLAVLSANLTKQSADNERVMSDRTATQQAFFNAAAMSTQAAAPAAALATREYQSTQNAITGMFATSRADYATQTADAPKAAGTAAALIARARYAGLEAVAAPISMILTPLAFIALCMVLVYGLRRPHVIVQPAAVEYDDEPDDAVITREPEEQDNDDLPPGIDEETMRKFMTYAVTGAPLGAESMAPVWGTSPAQREKRKKIMLKLAHDGHIDRFSPKLQLDKAGIIIWQIWLQKHPPTAQELAENSSPALHGDHVTADYMPGQGIDDPFAPTGPTYNAPLQKDNQ